jgi:hypothetical protein
MSLGFGVVDVLVLHLLGRLVLRGSGETRFNACNELLGRDF